MHIIFLLNKFIYNVKLFASIFLLLVSYYIKCSNKPQCMEKITCWSLFLQYHTLKIDLALIQFYQPIFLENNYLKYQISI